MRIHKGFGRIGVALLGVFYFANGASANPTIGIVSFLGLQDIQEFAGTGYGGEYAHVIRLGLRTLTYPVCNYPSPSLPVGWSVLSFNRYQTGGVAVQVPVNGDLTQGGVPVPTGGGMAALNENSSYELRMSGPGTRDFSAGYHLWVDWVIQDPSGHQYAGGDDFTYSQTATVTLTKRTVDMVSVDSRRVYGQPNIDGELPGDPNADLRNPSFVNWVYKGGLFVGNATGNDASGTARIQGWIPPATFTEHLLSSLTLRALGQPTAYPTPPTLQAYTPSATDPNIAATSANTTWSNRWDLGTATNIGDPTDVGTLPANEYYRIPFVETPTKIGLALSGESSITVGYWQYFASSAYETGLPLANSAPRIWSTDRTSETHTTHGWTYWDGHSGTGGPSPLALMLSKSRMIR